MRLCPSLYLRVSVLVNVGDRLVDNDFSHVSPAVFRVQKVEKLFLRQEPAFVLVGSFEAMLVPLDNLIRIKVNFFFFAAGSISDLGS